MKKLDAANRGTLLHGRRSYTSVLLIIIILLTTYSSVAQADPHPPAVAVHPNQLQYWPLLYGKYDVQAFLEGIQSPLAGATVAPPEGGAISFATALEAVGAQHNIHPRILLVLLEITAGSVSGSGTGRGGLSLSSFADSAAAGTSQPEGQLRRLAEAARLLRQDFNTRRESAWEEREGARYGASTNAVADVLATASGHQTSQAEEAGLLDIFAAQFEAWFGEVSTDAPEAIQEWISAESSLPYASGASGKYTSAPHTWNKTNNLKTQGGLDFTSDNSEILNIADGWLVEKSDCSYPGGRVASVLVDGTTYAVSYWHLASFSTALLGKDVGAFIPRGFPIGTQGGTRGRPDGSGGCNVDEHWSPHIHIELSHGKLFPQATYKQSDNTWDGKQLGHDDKDVPNSWVFWVDTTKDTRAVVVTHWFGTDKAWGYDGTAVRVNRATEIKQGVENDYWSVVEKGYVKPSKTPPNTDDTFFAWTGGLGSLASDNQRTTECENGPCPTPSLPVILAPTAQAVLQAGPHDSPESKSGPIRIVLDKSFKTLTKTDFAVSIGDKNAVVMESNKAGSYNEYELMVVPPNQTADGLYNLRVTVTVNGQETTASAPQSILYGEKVGVSYVLILDTSRSMNCAVTNPAQDCENLEPLAKITEAKATAQNFVQLLSSEPPQESAGLIRFDGSGGVNDDDGVTIPATADNKTHLSSVIGTLEASGGTPLYDAIRAAATAFAGSQSPTKVALLLSDGMRTTGSTDLDGAILAAQNAGVQVCSIRFGRAAVDLAVLNRISKETGCVAAQSALEPGQLSEAFDAIRASATGQQQVGTFTGQIQPGQTQTFSLPIDRLSQAVFKVTWQTPVAAASAQLRLNLVAPNGTRYAPDQLNGAELIVGPTMMAFRISNPLAGLWQLIVSTVAPQSTASAATAASIPFLVNVVGDSTLALRSYADSVVEAGSVLELGAAVAEAQPISGAKVLVTIQRPSGSRVAFPLLDDGRHNDGYANDGYYSALFDDAFETGTYRLEFEVEGVLPDGTSFSRSATREFQVEGDPGQGTREVPLDEGLNLVSLSGLAPSARDPRTALSSISGAYDAVLAYEYPKGGISFYPDLPDEFNTLKEIDPYQGFWIRTTQPITLEVAGPNLAQNASIAVHPGWNLLPYLPAASTPVTEALSSLDGQYLSVLGFRGGAMSYWPELPTNMNTLQVMEPGFGYWVKIGDQHGLLDYPAYHGYYPAESPTGVSETEQAQSTLNAPQSADGVIVTDRWEDFYSLDARVNGEPIPPGSRVSVYDSDGHKVGECVVHTSGQVGVLSVYGESALADAGAGAQVGEALTFRVNGVVAMASDLAGNPVNWTGHGMLQQIQLSVEIVVESIFLPLVTSP